MTELALVPSTPPQSLSDWKAYIAAASVDEAKAGQALVEAIIEKGRRIAEFYVAYKARGQRWGDRWSDVCKNTIGMSDDMCRRYMIVAENVPKAFGTFLPTALETLFNLSKVAKADQAAFAAAVAAGEINPKMTLPKARVLAERVQKNGTRPSYEPVTVHNFRNPFRGTSNPGLPPEEKARIRAMPEKMVSIHVLIEELLPLFARIKAQSKLYVGMISTMELAYIASEGQRLLDLWGSDDSTVRRMRGHVVPPKRPAKQKEG